MTLYLADCRDVLDQLSGIDAVIADPPYGMGYVSGHNSSRGDCDMVRKDGNFAPIIGDDEPFDPAPWINFPIVVLWGANHYAERLPSKRGWLIWDKLAGKTPCSQSDCEMAWTNLDQPTRIKTHLWRGIMRAGEENIVNAAKMHPNQKPVAVIAWAMEQAKVPKGATVLDPYMGSGTTGIACIRTGRRFIGIEKDPTHYQTALERIQRELAQGDLFRDSPND